MIALERLSDDELWQVVRSTFPDDQYEEFAELREKRRAGTITEAEQSIIQFAKEMRVFNLSEYFLRKWQTITNLIHKSQKEQQKQELREYSTLSFIASISSGVSFWLVISQTLSGRFSVGDIMLYMGAISSLQSSLSNVFSILSHLNESTLFYAKFLELLSLPQPIPLEKITIPVPCLKKGIEIKNVSFRYSDRQPWILRNINVAIPAGKCVALVGLNGAGKTTLVKLLARCYDPTEGQILWDGIDIRMFDPQDLRCHISAIFQDFIRYDLTAYENIGLGNTNYLNDEAYVQQAAIQTGIHDIIRVLPQGYQTILSRWLAGSGPGVDLSGGEWQKVAISRMLMRTADILMLDEPTAALDAQAEADIYHQFMSLVKGRTSLLISHRFSTVRMADIIAVLEQGAITEYGTHEVLLAQGGRYAKLYTLQADLYR